MQGWTYDAIFGLRLPDIITSGGIPITTATHSRRELYYRAQKISREYNTTLKFILLETPPIEEADRRCRDPLLGDKSDMTNLIQPNIRENYLQTVARIQEAYPPDFAEPHRRIPQGPIKPMAKQILAYILEE